MHKHLGCGGNVAPVGWQVKLCDPIWFLSFWCTGKTLVPEGAEEKFDEGFGEEEEEEEEEEGHTTAVVKTSTNEL